MTRLGTTNQAQVDGSHLHRVNLVKFEFDTPVYVHSGIGTITYDGNDYIGVGAFGGFSVARESEALGPSSITFTLDGVDADHITEGLDAGNLYDRVTLYEGYRQDDGTLFADPWVVWAGWYEYASISLDAESSVQITAQHDLSVLAEKDGGRLSDEDQQARYTGDVGLEFAATISSLKLLWGGGGVVVGFDGRAPRDDGPITKAR